MRTKQHIVVALILGFVVAAAWVGQSRRTNAEGVPARLGFAQAACLSAGPATATTSVTFRWQPMDSGGIVQWVDLSLFDNGFAPGTFIGSGPLSPMTTELTLDGILAGLPHYWRVNTLTDSGWVTSVPLGPGTFVPCGGRPFLRGISYSCTGNGLASVNFFWAPLSPVAFSAWLDLSLADNNFVPGTFVGNGPHSPGLQQLRWDGVLANMPHYWRVNLAYPPPETRPSTFWASSFTGTFVAVC